MPAIMIEPATAPRFADVEHTFSDGGDGASCQCQWWMMPNTQFQGTTREGREQTLRTELTGHPAPGLIAYVDGEPAAWVRVGPRTAQLRLARTRLFAAGSAEPWDDPDVWAVSCFVVRRDHRGEGLTSRLLAAAIEHARVSGARAVEAYPIDTAVTTRRTNELYTGVLSVFEEAGFRVVSRPKPDRAIVQLDLR